MKPLRIFLFTLFLMFITAVSWMCKDDVTNGDTTEIVFPSKNVSYGKQVEPLFIRACAIPACHTAESKADAGGLSLETYQEARSSPGVIISGDTVNSRLVWSLEALHGSPIMPPAFRPRLTQNQINGLKQWVFEGGLNN
jgi:hypothetical protein